MSDIMPAAATPSPVARRRPKAASKRVAPTPVPVSVPPISTSASAPVPGTVRVALKMTPAYYAAGRRHLMRQDPRLAAIIERAGPCKMRAYQDGEPFSALVETIVSQQLSTRVADVIFGRVAALCGPAGVSPARLLAIDPLQLRAAGLSHAKVRYVQELAAKVTDGTIVLDHLDALPDEEVTRVLSQVKGIGPWSTHMFLIFRLHRPDVWPTGDLAIVKALARFHRLRKTPPMKRLERMGEVWRPYRSLAAWYLWASLSLTDDAATK